MAYVYCFRFGGHDCFKVGKAGNPKKRKGELSTGSRDKLSVYRKVPTDNAPKLETYIHWLLGPRRRHKHVKDIFDVCPQELDLAVNEAVAFMQEFRPVSLEAKALSKIKPDQEVLKASEEMLAIYLELRSLRREKFLLERRCELLESKVKVAIGRCQGIDGVATWKWVDRPYLDKTRLIGDYAVLSKREVSEVRKEYTLHGGSRTFSLEGVENDANEPNESAIN